MTSYAAPDLGLGSTPPDYGTLKQDAISAYLSGGGSQQHVDDYFRMNTGEDYNKLATDAVGWYGQQAPSNGEDPSTWGATQAQNVGGYFGIPGGSDQIPGALRPPGSGPQMTQPGTIGPPIGTGGAVVPASTPYGTLKNDAIQQYLQSGGTQQNVDDYFRMNPGQDYNRLASDAAQQYSQQNPGQLGLNNISNYFGVGPLQGGGGAPIMAQPTSPNMSNASGTQAGGAQTQQSPYPQSWIDTYNSMDPATQQAISQRYAGMSPEQIMQDWEQNVMPRYAQGTSSQQILGGTSTLNGPDAYAGVGPNPYNNTGPNNWVGGPYSHEAAWDEPFHQYPGAGQTLGRGIFGSGQDVFAPGYGRGADGSVIRWDGGKPPEAGSVVTKEGQDRLRQPVTAGNQQFGNLNQFVKFMGTSTPEQQGFKRQMEHLDDQGGSLEAGERSLFDTFAQYLGSNVKKQTPGATPFTDFNPTGLLDLLMKAGILK